MDQDALLKDALQELMEQNDGVNPNSPIPIEQQLEAKRAEYKRTLEMKPLKEKIEQAVESIQGELKHKMQEDAHEALMIELARAGNILVETPEHKRRT
jgi:hypothetical protein